VGRCHEGASLLIEPAEPTEGSLSELAQEGKFTIIQRLGSGTVRIYHEEGISTWNGSTWLPKPYSTRYADIVVTAIFSLEPNTEDARICAAILDLCVHSLSSANVGATIVWDRTEREAEFEGVEPTYLVAVNRDHSFETPPLSVAKRSNHGPIRSLLAQFDRALIVDRVGTIREMGVALTPRPETVERLRTHGGTRHNSAIQFSEDEPHTIVFVVSQDGGVTVYRRGFEVVSSTRGIYFVYQYGPCSFCRPKQGADGSYVSDNPECPECHGTGRAMDDMDLLEMSHRDYQETGGEVPIPYGPRGHPLL
jgi:hypothetical protein